MLKELHTPKHPINDQCPNCQTYGIYDYAGAELNYCSNCGQAINHNKLPMYGEITKKMIEFANKLSTNRPVNVTFTVEQQSIEMSVDRNDIDTVSESLLINLTAEDILNIANDINEIDKCRAHSLHGLAPEYPCNGESVIVYYVQSIHQAYSWNPIKYKLITYADKSSFDNFTEEGIEYEILEWRRFPD